MFVNPKLLIQSALLAFVLVLLAACGGGGGGSTSTPTNPQVPGGDNPPVDPPPAPIKGLGFDSADSDVTFVALPDDDHNSTLVFMRDASASERIVVVLDDGTLIEAAQDDAGRLTSLMIGDHQFNFTSYTASTVTVTYHAPGGATVSEVVDLETGGIAATATADKIRLLKYGSNPTVEEYLDEKTEDGGAWLQNPSNTYLPLIILRLAGEAVADIFDQARIRLESALESTAEMVAMVHNRVTCTISSAACAEQVAEGAPTVIQDLESLDPAGQTTAGLDVTAEGVQPNREQWEAESNLDFSMIDVPCAESVFAQMNPHCPQYIPPEDPTDPTDPGEEEPLSVTDVILATALNTVLNGELGASGATGYDLQSLPQHGTITLNRITGAFAYAPASDYTGIDSFTFVATNGEQTSRVASVTIEVGDLVQEATDSSVSTEVDTPVSSNFQHVNATYFRVVQQPQNGTLTALDLIAGTFTYTPNTGFTGTDEIHFVAAGASGDSEPAIVTINVGGATEACVHTMLDNGTSQYRCPDYTEYWGGNMEQGGFTHVERPDGVQFGNSWYVQIEDGEIWVYDVEQNVYENGQLVYIEGFSLSVGIHSTHHEMDHYIDVRTYEGSTRTSSTRTRIDCDDHEVRRRVWEGQFSISPVEDETFDSRDICPTLEDAQAFANSIMVGGADMSLSYVTSSPAYTLANPTP